jgi:hypothetical protein
VASACSLHSGPALGPFRLAAVLVAAMAVAGAASFGRKFLLNDGTLAGYLPPVTHGS